MGTEQHLHTVKLLHLLMVDGDESRLMQALHLHTIMHNITQAVKCTALFQLFFSFLDGSGYAEAETTTIIYFYLHVLYIYSNLLHFGILRIIGNHEDTRMLGTRLLQIGSHGCHLHLHGLSRLNLALLQLSPASPW